MADKDPKEEPQSPITMLLFRITMNNTTQLGLWKNSDPLTPANRPTVLRNILKERLEITKDEHVWSIGNYRLYGADGVTFRIGRDLKRKRTMKNEDGDYIDEEDLAAGAVDVVLDTQLGVGALSPATELKTRPETVVRRLADIIESHEEIVGRGASIKAALLHDPTDFIDALNGAASILSIGFEISPPNPTDVDRDFTAKLENITSGTGAQEATFELKGGTIKADAVEVPARTASGLGRRVWAMIKDTVDSVAREINTTTTNVPIEATRTELSKEPSGILQRIRAVTNRVMKKADERAAQLPAGNQVERERTSPAPAAARPKRKKGRRRK